MKELIKIIKDLYNTGKGVKIGFPLSENPFIVYEVNNPDKSFYLPVDENFYLVVDSDIFGDGIVAYLIDSNYKGNPKPIKLLTSKESKELLNKLKEVLRNEE